MPDEDNILELRVRPEAIGLALATLRAALRTMTDEQRLELFSEVMADYCRHCGAERVPCYCTRDD